MTPLELVLFVAFGVLMFKVYGLLTTQIRHDVPLISVFEVSLEFHRELLKTHGGNPHDADEWTRLELPRADPSVPTISETLATR